MTRYNTRTRSACVVVVRTIIIFLKQKNTRAPNIVYRISNWFVRFFFFLSIFPIRRMGDRRQQCDRIVRAPNIQTSFFFFSILCWGYVWVRSAVDDVKRNFKRIPRSGRDGRRGGGRPERIPDRRRRCPAPRTGPNRLSGFTRRGVFPRIFRTIIVRLLFDYQYFFFHSNISVRGRPSEILTRQACQQYSRTVSDAGDASPLAQPSIWIFRFPFECSLRAIQ